MGGGGVVPRPFCKCKQSLASSTIDPILFCLYAGESIGCRHNKKI